jgi:hypothetical protein
MAQQRMLTFVSVEQQTPEKREPDERRADFHEIYADFITAKANEQSSRCSQCGVPFCQVHCPVSNNIPDWRKLTAEGRLMADFPLEPQLAKLLIASTISPTPRCSHTALSWLRSAMRFSRPHMGAQAGISATASTAGGTMTAESTPIRSLTGKNTVVKEMALAQLPTTVLPTSPAGCATAKAAT